MPAQESRCAQGLGGFTPCTPASKIIRARKRNLVSRAAGGGGMVVRKGGCYSMTDVSGFNPDSVPQGTMQD